MDAYLILEDGSTWKGTAIGANREVICEIVFNTSMTGYVEVLSDPSYAGQAVTMTYPLIGNYGISHADMESEKPWLSGFIVHQLSRLPSSWRSENTIQNFLKTYDVPGISGIDTRTLTKVLRDKGTMNGCITTHLYQGEELAELLNRIRAFRIQKPIRQVTTKTVYTVDGNGPAIALMDFGEKRNIIRSLNSLGCRVTVYPAYTTAEEILQSHPDGIMLSNGPGDPKDNPEIIREVRKLYEANVPIFAICLGHQLMALATGADTYKLPFGHRGANHPVKDVQTGRVYITSQNHGYAVNAGSLDPSVAEEAFYNVNDGTNEGLRYRNKRILTVQFHPEASPGPVDSAFLFREFLQMIEEADHA